MAADFTILGRLTKDPEVKSTPAGQAIAKLSVAVSNRYKGKEETSFFPVTAFGKTGDLAAKYLTKGSQVYVSGEMRQWTWTPDEGEKKMGYDFFARKIVFIGGGKNKPPAADSKDDFIPEIDDIPL
jgi:single-strand DNA-binding protein